MKVMKQFHALEKVERTAEMILPLDLQDPSHMPILEIVMNPIPEKPGHPKEAWNPDHVLIILGRAQTKEQRQKLIYVRAKELETRPKTRRKKPYSCSWKRLVRKILKKSEEWIIINTI